MMDAHETADHIAASHGSEQPTDPPGILRGGGELRREDGAGETASYSGHIMLAGRTIVIRAAIATDERGRFFRLIASLDPASYTEAELDRLFDGRPAGSGFGMPQRSRRPAGPLVDDPIPFGAP